MEENGILPNVFTYNALVRGFLRCSIITEMTTFMKEMTGRGFSFDATTTELLLEVLRESPSVLDMILDLHSKIMK
ncbi:hypothetical protein EJD97_003471 [Solanum chilense]|uniref:Pentatricopeptide repeat-containing protein n=1 Tax=Solanum chilense TaxID=4083 RepID=A0A6N2BWM8_SOLCI|nr:hypothetical protein EJD97_003471 [Solanum chilense]